MKPRVAAKSVFFFFLLSIEFHFFVGLVSQTDIFGVAAESNDLVANRDFDSGISKRSSDLVAPRVLYGKMKSQSTISDCLLALTLVLEN